MGNPEGSGENAGPKPEAIAAKVEKIYTDPQQLGLAITAEIERRKLTYDNLKSN